ncbi:SDR family NAD(P)-dependent oxidoreductase [Aurantiacibacter spongiae]|uniref:SDR family NAD(P)-dependent oxidoreductase n=1 Tax=Aurantiacibacter spongiae TaxID=2488860 RepID=A0A3N5DR73_9SPHN|nr:SDR family NAD(P)-dependent oxidoreductase [Aurantiacibacter spongiae]RPF71651.1 SDR family NAD(P)-dependent oxidoreductase [Aurantiacibacter spongiae]
MSKNPVDKLTGFVIVTGASSGIGLELTKLIAKDGCALLLVANEDLSQAETAARELGAAEVETLQTNLATRDGIAAVMDAVGDRNVDVLVANAGNGDGGAFLDQDWDAIKHALDTNVTGTISLIHKIGGRMKARGSGRMLVTGSIVGDMPGPFNLVYNSTKAFIDDFCVGLANELKETDLVVTCLLPGATDTAFFERAGMEDTSVGQSKKADPAKVAEDGYDALIKGEIKEVSGIMNKLQYLVADILPAPLIAKLHRRMAQPQGKETEAAD